MHSILYFTTGIAFIALETSGAAWAGTVVKALIMPCLIWLYIRFVRDQWNLFHRMILIALFFSWVGDIILQLVPFRESLFLVGLGSFLFTQLIYLITFFSTPGKNVLLSWKFFLVLPVALYGWGMLELLADGLGDMKLPLTAYTVVILTMLLASINRQGKVNRQSFWLVLAGAILFVLSGSLIAIDKFNQPFELARMAIMSSYITAQYLIAVGCTRQFNLTLQ